MYPVKEKTKDYTQYVCVHVHIQQKRKLYRHHDHDDHRRQEKKEPKIQFIHLTSQIEKNKNVEKRALVLYYTLFAHKLVSFYSKTRETKKM